MELHLGRTEILAQVRSLLGMQQATSLAGQVDDQHLAAVKAAALKVMQDCRWVTAQRHVSVETGIEADTLNYPQDVGAGAILGIAVYESDRYYPLESRIIPAQADTDVEQAIGQPTYAKVLGRPRYYEQRDQIKLWPTTDKSYHLRIEILLRGDLPTNNSVSIVDGQLIIYKAVEMISLIGGELDMAKYYGAQYVDRLTTLRGWQSADTRFAMDSEADMGEDEFFNQDLIPRWDRGIALPGSNIGPTTV